MFTHHSHLPLNSLHSSHAFGTSSFSPERPKSLCNVLLLSPPSTAHRRRKPKNFRISSGKGTHYLQTACLWLCDHARACSPPAQRASAEHACGRVEVAEARSVAAFVRRRGAFLAKTLLRFQHPKLPAVCRETALHPPQSSEGRLVRTSRRLAVEQFSPHCNRGRGSRRNRVGMDCTKTRTSCGQASSSHCTAPLKPTPGLNGPPSSHGSPQNSRWPTQRGFRCVGEESSPYQRMASAMPTGPGPQRTRRSGATTPVSGDD